MAKTLRSTYIDFIRASRNLPKSAKIDVDKRVVEAYKTYKKRYREQAIKVESQLRFSTMSRRKKFLIQERKDIRAARPLTPEEKAYYNKEIKANTLTKEAKKEIVKDLSRDKFLALRDPMLSPIDFYAQYEDTKRELEREDIKGDPMQYIVRQQAYKISSASYEALETAWEDEQEAAPDESIFLKPFKEYSEVEIRTGAVNLEEIIDYDAIDIKYHELKSLHPEWGGWDLRKEIGRLYFGS